MQEEDQEEVGNHAIPSKPQEQTSGSGEEGREVEGQERLPLQEESPEATEGALPERDSQGQRVVLKSLGRLLVEDSLMGDSRVPYPDMGALVDNTHTYWPEDYPSYLDCPN